LIRPSVDEEKAIRDVCKQLAFNFHGVRMRLASDRSEYLEPTEVIFSRYRCEPSLVADLHVRIIAAEAFWNRAGNPANGKAVEDAMQKIGRRVFVHEDSVYVNRFLGYRGLAGLYHEKDGRGAFTLIYDRRFAESGIDLYQSCHQLFGIWPVATYLALKRNMFFLHGGAATFGGRGIVLVGLQGVGKSTLLLRMLRDPEARLLSDNIYFHDAEKVYACPETIRIDNPSLEFIDPPGDLLRDTGHDSDLGRKMYVVNAARTCEHFVPDVFIIPRFHPDKSAIVPLNKNEDARNMFAVFCELAMELNTFHQWAAPFLLRDGCFSTNRHTALQALLKNKPIYHLHIRKGDNPDLLLDLIRSV